MPTISADWAAPAVVRAPTPLAVASEATHDIDLGGAGSSRADVMVELALGAATSVRVEFLGSVDGVNFETVPAAAYTATLSESRKTVVDGRYVRVRLTNLDQNNPTGSLGITQSSLRWQSA